MLPTFETRIWIPNASFFYDLFVSSALLPNFRKTEAFRVSPPKFSQHLPIIFRPFLSKDFLHQIFSAYFCWLAGISRCPLSFHVSVSNKVPFLWRSSVHRKTTKMSKVLTPLPFPLTDFERMGHWYRRFQLWAPRVDSENGYKKLKLNWLLRDEAYRYSRV